MAVFFHFNDTRLPLHNRRKLGNFLREVFSENGKNLVRLEYVFCTDAFLLAINQQFLAHDTYTDIVTFDLSDDPGRLRAEIYISADRVKENAIHFKVSLEEELHRVIFHGILHLCGFGDKKMQEKKVMRQKENELIRRYFNLI